MFVVSRVEYIFVPLSKFIPVSKFSINIFSEVKSWVIGERIKEDFANKTTAIAFVLEISIISNNFFFANSNLLGYISLAFIDLDISIAITIAFSFCFNSCCFSFATGRESAIIINIKEINKIIFLDLFEKYLLEIQSFSKISFEKYLSNEFFFVRIRNIKTKTGISIR